MGRKETRAEAVEAFIEKIGAKKESLRPSITRESRSLCGISKLLDVAIGILLPLQYDNPAIHRFILLLEEVNELTESITFGNEIFMLDALADISYIVEGTAVIHDLPLDAAFKEVHRSNMTKNPNAKFKTGDKGKDTSYSPPDIKGIIDAYRA